MKKLLLILLLLLFPQLIASQEVRTALVKDSGKQVYRCDLGVNADEVSIDLETSPKVSFSKWNKENSLSIKIPAGLINYTAPTIKDSKTIEIGDSKVGFYFNRFDDENFKFGLILHEKPATNTWSFQLEGWEEFDFFYQPPLKNVNSDGSTWEDNGRGGRNTRPLKVNGSWAIYHKTKRDYILGQTNYGIGKFGHIYNVLFTDVDGKTERIYPDIKNGVYSVTISQKFLDEAKYPIKANDTFGKSDTGGSDASQLKNYINGQQVTAPANGTLSSLSMYMYCADTNSNISMAFYADGGSDYPTTRLDYGTQVNPLPTSYGTATSTGLTYSIVSGTKYWLGWNTDVNYTMKYDSGGISKYKAVTYTYPLVNPFTASASNDANTYSIYATYTPSATAVNTLLTNCSLTKAGLRTQ